MLTVVYGLVVTVISLIFSGFVFEFNVITLLFGIANAVALVGYNAFLVKASQTGSYSIMMVFNLSGGIVIPAVVSVFFGDKLSIIQILSILLIFVSVYMLSKKEEDVKNSAIFFWCPKGINFDSVDKTKKFIFKNRIVLCKNAVIFGS